MRIILDIANQDNPNLTLLNIIDALIDKTASVVCIDETNTNQFHNDTTKNTLTDEQLQRYHDYCHSEEPHNQTK